MAKAKDVNLLIKVSQGFVDRFDSFEIFTNAKLKTMKNSINIKFSKSDGGFSEVILLKPFGNVLIKSCGNVDYVLKLDKSKSTKSTFKFKDSYLFFSVDTKEIEIDLTEETGRLHFEYFLGFDLGTRLTNKVDIKITRR